MTHPFPDVPTFSGFDWPVRADADIYDLEIVGEIPRELNGTFYRCGPEHQYPPMRDGVFIDGDGVISMFRFEDGHVDFRTRFVRTERFLAERKARRSLFGGYRNPYLDDPAVAGVERGTANTTAFWHAGRLFALKEDSRPMEIDPDTLATRGRWDYGGKLHSKTATAHPEIDPRTGELFMHGFFSRGGIAPEIAYWVVDQDGGLVREFEVTPPYASMIHDIAVTGEHIVFPVMPTTPDDRRMRRGGPIFQWDDSLPSYLGVMRRDGDGSDIRWFKGPPQWMYHIMNAWTDGGHIHIDCCVSEIQSFPFFTDINGKLYEPTRARPKLTRWSIDLNGPDEFTSTRFFDRQCEYPRVDDRFQMAPYRHGYLLFTDPDRRAEATTRRSGQAFNSIARFDMTSGTLVESWFVGEASAPMEPQFVPRSDDAPEGSGWILMVVNRYAEGRSDLVVLDAQNLAQGPVAIAKLSLRARAAFHGCWVSAAQLQAARGVDQGMR
ncbi:MAG: carotenoid oxygenase family protein [Gammaproteobacteria bacterium]|nr:carotenoid oxygenase family protein [Gammaproteobacteria bacterium]